jgi:hypothetical protein
MQMNGVLVFKEKIQMKKRSISLLCFSILFLVLCISAFGQGRIILGKEEGEGFLIYPSRVQEGPDGNIYVFDWGDSFIKVYSPEGKYLRRIGGEGQGPGEVQRADGANFGFTRDEKLYFTEYIRGHRWITFMELSGEFIHVLTPEINQLFGISGSYPLKDGSFLVEFSLNSAPEMTKDYFLYTDPQSLLRIDSDGKVVSEVIKKEYFTMISSVGDGATSNLPFTPVFQWAPFKNDTVLFSDGMSTNFHVYDYQGNLVREIVTDLPKPEKVTGKDLNAWRKQREEYMMVANPDWYNRFGRVIDKYKKSLYDRPNMDEFTITPEGNILVAGPTDYENTEGDYWLLDENGKTLAHIKTTVGGLRIFENFLFFGTVDENMNIFLHCVKRKGSEQEDFLRIKDIQDFE